MSADNYQHLMIHLKDDIKVIEIIKSLISDGWKLPNSCNIIYEKEFYNEEIGENDCDSGDINLIYKENSMCKENSNFYKKIKDIFDSNDSITITLLENIGNASHYLSFHKIADYDLPYASGQVYGEENSVILNNVSFFRIKSGVYPSYLKPIEWEYWEGLLVSPLIEAGIEIKKVEFEHSINDWYRYHKFKHYNKKDDGSFEITEEIHVNISNFTIEIDGLKIKTKDDFIDEIERTVKENHGVKLFHDYMGNPIEKTLNVLNSDISKGTHRMFDKITWKDLKHSIKHLKDDFDIVADLIKKNGITLDEKESDGTIKHLYQKPYGLPIRKIGKKEEFEKEMQDYLKGIHPGYFESRKDAAFNIFKLYDYEITKNDERNENNNYDFKIKVNNEEKSFIFHVVKSEALYRITEGIFKMLEGGLNLVLNIDDISYDYKELFDAFKTNSDYVKHLDYVFIFKGLKPCTLKEIEELLGY